MAKKKAEQRKWIVRDGSIFVEEEDERYDPEWKIRTKYHVAVAFNVGDVLAKHIVEVHNKGLQE